MIAEHVDELLSGWNTVHNRLPLDKYRPDIKADTIRAFKFAVVTRWLAECPVSKSPESECRSVYIQA